MFFKILYILFLLNISFSQSFFNRIQPDEIYLGDARSMSIGNILSTSSNSGLLISHPEQMPFTNKRINFDFDIEIQSISERRSNQFKDYFDSFIEESDYVFNQNNDFKYSFSLIFNIGANTNNKMWDFAENLSIGISYKPFSSFDYSFKEELRGGWSNGSNLGIKDPIVGYHILDRAIFFEFF